MDLLDRAVKAYARDCSIRYDKARNHIYGHLDTLQCSDAKVDYLECILTDAGAYGDSDLLDILQETPTSPGSAGNRPARAKRYNNTFRYGLARNGIPYFTREGKPHKSDLGTVTLTSQEASKYFQLLGEDKEGAWVDYKHELYEKYRAA